MTIFIAVAVTAAVAAAVATTLASLNEQMRSYFFILAASPETAQKHSCKCLQAPLPWDMFECISLARVLQRMAHLLKQQPLHDSSVQQVSIVAQCSGVMFHLLMEKLMQNAMSRASIGVSCGRHVCKCCSETQISPEELAGIRAESTRDPCPVLHQKLQ